ncbi:tetratricopeptide repeat protein [Striga asiatica]|uniref:Tetratricopeptide repeat protein n=1 Tax=Striga asiatica TaxID=4170 RepID=A0A5A7P4B3_STRAF|nr:tetratricopeptide repeat protein [Striga asiatica]
MEKNLYRPTSTTSPINLATTITTITCMKTFSILSIFIRSYSHNNPLPPPFRPHQSHILLSTTATSATISLFGAPSSPFSVQFRSTQISLLRNRFTTETLSASRSPSSYSTIVVGDME